MRNQSTFSTGSKCSEEQALRSPSSGVMEAEPKLPTIKPKEEMPDAEDAEGLLDFCLGGSLSAQSEVVRVSFGSSGVMV